MLFKSNRPKHLYVLSIATFLFCGVSIGLLTGLLTTSTAMASTEAAPRAQITDDIVQITAGDYHTCLLTSAGVVECWGNNEFGQLDLSQIDRSSPMKIAGLTNDIIAIDAGYYHTCALTSGGGVKCWGYNSQSQLGNGTSQGSSLALDVFGLTSGVSAISVQGEHSCALMNSGGVQCWGDNRYGQLGNGVQAESTIPKDVIGLPSTIKAISAGALHTCALEDAGVVYCWGSNYWRQLGNSNSASVQLTAGNITNLSGPATSISAGERHSCALIDNGVLQCWGWNADGQLGDGTTSERSSAVEVTGLPADLVSVHAADLHTCAVSGAGGAMCWGNNDWGQLGDGTTLSHSAPTDVVSLASDVMDIATGLHYTCALLDSSGIKCWGENNAGQLGNGEEIFSTRPRAVDLLANNIETISSSWGHTCITLENGTVKCWGDNSYGQLGIDSPLIQMSPVDVDTLGQSATSISIGHFHTCIQTDSAGVSCWGRNRYGQLGTQTVITNTTVPVALGTLNNSAGAIAAGREHTCVLTTDGGVKCWGDNSQGQLGDGTLTNRFSPTSVNELSGNVTNNVSELAAGWSHTCVLMDSGTVKCWGNNVSGQLGDGSESIRRTVPTEVVDLGVDVVSVVTGGFHTCALANSGSVHCWGDNDHGQLGDGTTTKRRSPVTVAGLPSGVRALTAGVHHTCAAIDSGAVFCWGQNTHGELGIGSLIDMSVPTEVQGLNANIVALSAGGFHTCAVTDEGAAHCWGRNIYGELGTGRTLLQPAPIDVFIIKQIQYMPILF